MTSQYYDGTKLLSLLDINGDKPELYLCTSNRTAGKTTYFSRMLVNSYLKGKGKFMLIYRFNYELSECADKFFKDIGRLFFPDHVMTGKVRARGVFVELFLDEKSCGYAVALNSADNIKRYSHLFSDVERMFMDEFQSETNHYCPDEVQKLLSVHTSVARGGGKQIRYVPVYMTGNPVTLLNPYYVALNITKRLKSETHFLKGEGFVLEQGFVESASKAQAESAFNRAFKNDSYVAYSTEGLYLNDNLAFVEKPVGNSRYVVTLKYMDKEYGIREYVNEGIVYCDDSPDLTFKQKITVTTDDHQINYVMLKRNDMFLGILRYYFEKGCFRFKDLMCKEVILKALSY